MDLDSELIAPRAFPGKEMDIHSSESWVRLKAEMIWALVKAAMVHIGGTCTSLIAGEQRWKCYDRNTEHKSCT